MSTHSYSRLWTHLIWETLNREPMLDKRAAAKASTFLCEYSLQTRTLTLAALLDTLPIKKNIIESGRMQRSIRCL
jgi:hypothetical protein